MTAVLHATDAFRTNRPMAALDDSHINYSSSDSADWKTKYNEVADMLAETRAELDDFHVSSKELEEELERELERTEKAQQDLRVKVEKAEQEREEWKGKFVTLQTTHNTTTTSLQRELDTLRQEHQKIKIQLRELEMGNDDLERNERAVSSSLADAEARYSRALEEKILLEHELLDKANLEEETQRLKDELRDANEEITILRSQLAQSPAAESRISVESEFRPSTPSANASSIFPQPASSEDNLLSTTPPPDMSLAEITPPDRLSPLQTTPKPKRTVSPTKPTPGTAALLKRTGIPSPSRIATPPSARGIPRSTTVPSMSSVTPTRIAAPPVLSRPNALRNPPSILTASTSSSVTGTRSKGVQMVNDMRHRVRALEQRLHTKVPRLRMGSVSSKPNVPSISSSPAPLSPLVRSGSIQTETSEVRRRFSLSSRRSVEEPVERKKTPVQDSSGWVLIMEDSPSPRKLEPKERRRLSSPPERTPFRPSSTTRVSPTPYGGPKNAKINGIAALARSTANPPTTRRPVSRLSGASLSTTATGSSLPTPSSRPATPTHLPLPTPSRYVSHGLAKSTGPPGAFGLSKRSSLGATPNLKASTRERGMTIPAQARPGSSTPSSIASSHDGDKALPQIPVSNPNVTLRTPARPPGFTQSRIGRPSVGAAAPRRSAGNSPAELDAFAALMESRRSSADNSGRPGTSMGTYGR